MKFQWPVAVGAKTPPPLRPAGHSAAAEAMVQPIIFLGSTILAIVACYVLAQPQIGALAAGDPNALDVLLIMLVAGLGVMVDTAMVLSASRFRMHLARGKRDWPWAIITGLMLLLCLSVESMTLVYFGYLVSPSSVPTQVASIVVSIHDVLFFIRNLMPPLVIAFFTTCLLPLTIEPADRDRATKATTSVTIAALQEDLVKVGPLASRAAKIQALADQIALNEHASHATSDEKVRNAALITQLRTQGTLTAEDEGMFGEHATGAAHLSLGDHLEAVEASITGHLDTWGAAFRAEVRDAIASLTQQLVQPDTQLAASALDATSGRGVVFRERTGETFGDPFAEEGDDEQGWGSVRRAVEAVPVHVAAADAGHGAESEVLTDEMVNAPMLAQSNASGSARKGAQRSMARLPRPGTRPFRRVVYQTIMALQREEGQQRTFLTIAQHVGNGATADDVHAAFDAMRAERLNKKRPGDLQEMDPVLDDAALLVADTLPVAQLAVVAQ